MKRPVLTVMVAFFVVALGILLIGSMVSGQSRIEQSVVMKGTPERIFPLFADLKGWPSWYWSDEGYHMTTSTLIGKQTVAVGTIRRAQESAGGFWEEKVTVFEPNTRIAFEGTRTPGRKSWNQEITLEPVGADETKVTWKLDYDVEGPILKLLNKAREEEVNVGYVSGALKGLAQQVPSAEDWGPSDAGKQGTAATAPAVTVPAVVVPVGGEAAPAAGAQVDAAAPAPEGEKK